MVRTLVMVIARMMLCGVTPALAQQDHSASDEKLYENVQKQFAEAYNRQNADAMAALFSENGIRVTPNGIFQGRDAIRRGLRHVLAMGLHDYTVRRTSPIRRVISFSMSVNGKPSWAIGSSTGINQSATCS